MGKKNSKVKPPAQDSVVMKECDEHHETGFGKACYINIHAVKNSSIVLNLTVKEGKNEDKILKRDFSNEENTMLTSKKNKNYFCVQCTDSTEGKENRKVAKQYLHCRESSTLAISNSSYKTYNSFRSLHLNDSDTTNAANEIHKFHELETPESTADTYGNTISQRMKFFKEEPSDHLTELVPEIGTQNIIPDIYQSIRSKAKHTGNKRPPSDNGLNLSFLSVSDNNFFSSSVCATEESKKDTVTEEKKMLEEKNVTNGVANKNWSHSFNSDSEYPRSTSYERDSCSESSLSEENKSDAFGDDEHESTEEISFNCQDEQNYTDSSLHVHVLDREYKMEEEQSNKEFVDVSCQTTETAVKAIQTQSDQVSGQKRAMEEMEELQLSEPKRVKENMEEIAEYQLTGQKNEDKAEFQLTGKNITDEDNAEFQVTGKNRTNEVNAEFQLAGKNITNEDNAVFQLTGKNRTNEENAEVQLTGKKRAMEEIEELKLMGQNRTNKDNREFQLTGQNKAREEIVKFQLSGQKRPGEEIVEIQLPEQKRAKFLVKGHEEVGEDRGLAEFQDVKNTPDASIDSGFTSRQSFPHSNTSAMSSLENNSCLQPKYLCNENGHHNGKSSMNESNCISHSSICVAFSNHVEPMSSQAQSGNNVTTDALDLARDALELAPDAELATGAALAENTQMHKPNYDVKTSHSKQDRIKIEKTNCLSLSKFKQDGTRKQSESSTSSLKSKQDVNKQNMSCHTPFKSKRVGKKKPNTCCSSPSNSNPVGNQKQNASCLTPSTSKPAEKRKRNMSCPPLSNSKPDGKRIQETLFPKPIQNSNAFDSDTSLDPCSLVDSNLCQYCKESLDTRNKKCKHHKPIKVPKAERSPDDSEGRSPGIFKDESKVSGEIKNQEIITQKDSGLGSSSHGSYKSYFTRQQLNEFRKQVETVARRELERLTAKEVAREIHVRPTNLAIYGLSSYFDRLNSGEPISEEERLHYEWLRLATFQHYTGEGNSITLARHGFYHDPSAGPTSTRCYLCEARHSNWTYFDNVEAEHRRQSPNCPFHENHNQESTNIPITYDNTSQSAARRPPTVNTTNLPSTVASNVTDDRGSITSSIREVTGSLTQAQISSSRNAAVQQPQDNDESRQHSLLALPNSRPYRVLGRSGETAYSHLTTPPRRNNIATGAESNAGLDAVANSTATSTATSTTTSTFRPSSVLGGPIGAGAFGASNPPASSTAPTSSSVTSTSAIPRGVLSTKASLLTPSQPPIGGGGRTDPTITVVVNNPKHPDYRDLDARINSFQGWPDYLDQTARQMAEAGFFFVGVADFTRCFCCGGGLRNWEPGDDPMLEHTRWFPRCEYVNKLKGERYVAAVQRRHQEHMAEQQRQQQELAQRRDANRNPPDPMNTEAAAVLREMGYQQERIRDAILAVRQQIGVPDVTTQQVLAWLLDQHEGRSPPTSNRTSPTRDLGVKVNMVVTPSTTQTSTPSTVINTTASVSTATSTVLAGSTSTSTVSSTSTATGAGNQQSGSSTSSTGSTGAGSKPASQSGSEAREGSNVDKQSAATRGESDEEEFKSAEETPSPDVKSTGKKKSKKKTKTKGGSKSTGASGGPVDAKSLKEENEKLREMQTCKICMERPVNTTLLPCGHLVCCDICAGRLNRCPICRKRIQGTVKTFMS